MFDINSIQVPENIWWGLITVCLFSFLSYFSKKIDGIGAVGGGIIAFFIFLGGGFYILGLLFVFFVLGSMASSWKIEDKIKLGLAEKNKGKRSLINAVSNGGVAAVCGLLAFLIPIYQDVFVMMLAASLAAATSDTLSSELGNIYGSRYISIISFKKGQRGLDGVISLEGTLFGVLGSVAIAACYSITSEIISAVIVVAVSGVIGNLIDSLLGATLQQRHWLNNHGVNLLNTLAAALIAGGFHSIF